MATSRLETLSRGQIAQHLEGYPAAIARKSSQSTRTGETLVDLDGWYQSLPALCTPSSAGLCGKADLVRLMHWKLAREKHRPTLLALIASNDASVCSKVLARAASHLTSPHPSLESTTEELLTRVEGAMRILAELRGIGPATSSAIVATWSPTGVFQSDELALALLGTHVKVEYTWSFYRRFYRSAIEVLKGWEGGKDGKVLERVAWSMAHRAPADQADPPKPRAEGVKRTVQSKATPEREVEKSKGRVGKTRTQREPKEKEEGGTEGARRTSKRLRTQ